MKALIVGLSLFLTSSIARADFPVGNYKGLTTRTLRSETCPTNWFSAEKQIGGKNVKKAKSGYYYFAFSSEAPSQIKINRLSKTKWSTEATGHFSYNGAICSEIINWSCSKLIGNKCKYTYTDISSCDDGLYCAGQYKGITKKK